MRGLTDRCASDADGCQILVRQLLGAGGSLAGHPGEHPRVRLGFVPTVCSPPESSSEVMYQASSERPPP
uniref:Uncharacterized protein n=1 Tax=Streptomyces sp. FR1 TaxID=349971 RepID=V9Z3S1_9ACTN|nr:hypothetical protein pFRL2_88c [Streptomyces sp. FR1]